MQRRLAERSEARLGRRRGEGKETIRFRPFDQKAQ